MNMANATKNECHNSKIMSIPKLIHDIVLNVKISRSLKKHILRTKTKYEHKNGVIGTFLIVWRWW